MSFLRDLNIVKCIPVQSALVFPCFMHSGAVSAVFATYSRSGGIITAVAGPDERWPCNRRGSGLILAVTVPFPR